MYCTETVVVDGRLNWNLRTLLDRGLFVVLRHHAWLGKQFTHALRFCRGDKEVDREVRRTVRKSETRSR